MIKVVIVEDMPPILWSIRQKIESCSPEIKVVGETYNGKDGLRMIKELKPDIVITDVRMPVMDGLEMIALAKQFKPDTHMVIISGHDEFEYARQAMKLGVTEYILKPATQEAIHNILNKLIAQINEKTSKQKENILHDILSLGKYDGITDYQFDCKYFVLAVHCAGSYPNHAVDYANPFNFFWSGIDFQEIVSQYIPSGLFSWCFDGKGLNEMFLLLGIPEGWDAGYEDMIRQYGEVLFTLGVPINIAVSKKIGHIGDIGMEARNTRLLMKKSMVFGKSNVIFSERPEPKPAEKSQVIDPSLEKKLIALIQSRQKEAFLNELKKITDYWESNSFTQYSIENSLKYLCRICGRAAAIGKPGSSYDPELEVEEILCISKDYPTLLKGLASMFEPFFPGQPEANYKREPMKEIVDKVETHIKANFSKQITINDIAEKVNVDPCHLSKTFKAIKGIGPMDFLTGLRIEKSKELMQNNSALMLRDIAEIVGYANQYYFSRIFKTFTGMTPSEFKSRHGNNDILIDSV